MTATEVVPEEAADEASRGGRRWARVAADLIRLARPPQWSKNILVIPLALASAPEWTAGTVLRTGWAVIVFCLASSLVYVVNDISDHARDRDHPVKRWRPLAQGRISLPAARIYAATIAAALCGAVVAGPALSWWPLYAYVALNFAYSRWLKHVPLLDVCVVAAGFGLRVLQGHAATGSALSGWLLVTVLTACLVVLVGKRRHELSIAGVAHRPALRGYNVAFADQLLAVNAILTVLTFLLYLRFDAPVGGYQTGLSAVAAPLVLFGVFRYLQSVLVGRRGGDPVRTLFRDRLIVADAILLTAAVVFALVAAPDA
ncbi:UbiA prenyltransferase family protein [Actinomycetes bacterium KLBMP 9797]